MVRVSVCESCMHVHVRMWVYRDYKSVGEDVWLCEGHSQVRCHDTAQ